jgi:hypothetical protein
MMIGVVLNLLHLKRQLSRKLNNLFMMIVKEMIAKSKQLLEDEKDQRVEKVIIAM